jgi:hypothetical protein
LEAVRELNKLLQAQADAMIEGRPKLEHLEVAIVVARERKEQAMLACALHTQSHGC